MPVKLQSSSGGSVTLDVPVTANNYNLTVPAASGTAMVSGNIPTFSAYLSGDKQSVSNLTWTKVTLNAEDFDTANCFDSTTNYRFTPNVAGYYQIHMVISCGSGSYGQEIGCALYKNGSRVRWAQNSFSSEIINVGGPTLSVIIYMNGSTDYLEMYALCQASLAPAFRGSTSTISTYMSGVLVRNA